MGYKLKRATIRVNGVEKQIRPSGPNAQTINISATMSSSDTLYPLGLIGVPQSIQIDWTCTYPSGWSNVRMGLGQNATNNVYLYYGCGRNFDYDEHYLYVKMNSSSDTEFSAVAKYQATGTWKTTMIITPDKISLQYADGVVNEYTTSNTTIINYIQSLFNDYTNLELYEKSTGGGTLTGDVVLTVTY